MSRFDETQSKQKTVGGRTTYSSISEISTHLNQENDKDIRTQSHYGSLICAFSSKRYHKDKSEMEKQIKKAESLLRQPSKTKRVKFLKNKGKAKHELNQELIQKTERLLGIKGYYTNLDPEISNQTIINHYHSLWHIEQAFRIAKSDLQIWPVYHFKKDPIYAHILICFMALAVCKYMEVKTGKSTKQIVNLLKSVTDARIRDKLSGKEIKMRSEISNEVKEILEDLSLSY